MIVLQSDPTTAGLWLAVIASGLYHGLNPGMGWPLAVAAGLMEKNGRAAVSAFGPLTLGHLIAIAVILVPFSLLALLAGWQRQIQIGAALLLIAFGAYKFINRRHPRALARIKPTELGLWSFAVATAHGAGLMIVPIYLGLCGRGMAQSHYAEAALINSDMTMALVVAIAHSLAMLTAAGSVAWIVYRYLGVRFIAKSWFNLDGVWALSLIAVGAVSLALTLYA